MKLNHYLFFRKALILSMLLTVFCINSVYSATKPRIIFTSDIGGDLDDHQTLVRFLSYSNEFQIEGLIASWGYGVNPEGTHPEIIQAIVNAYGQVRNNLLLHDSDYPTTAYLSAHIKSGNPLGGIGSIGGRAGYPGIELDYFCSGRCGSRPGKYRGMGRDDRPGTGIVACE